MDVEGYESLIRHSCYCFLPHFLPQSVTPSFPKPAFCGHCKIYTRTHTIVILYKYRNYKQYVINVVHQCLHRL